MSKVYEILKKYGFRESELSLRKVALRADEHWRYEKDCPISVFRRGGEWLIEAAQRQNQYQSGPSSEEICKELKQAMGSSYCGVASGQEVPGWGQGMIAMVLAASFDDLGGQDD